METSEEFIYEIKFQSFLDRFYNNSNFKLILFLEIILIYIGIFLFLLNKGFYILIIMIIIIIKTYKNKYKIKFFKNYFQITDIRFLGGNEKLKKKYTEIIGYKIKNKNVLIFYKTKSEQINEIKIYNLLENEIFNLEDLFLKNNIYELEDKKIKNYINQTISHQILFKILPIGIILSVSFVLFFFVILYLFLIIF